MSGGAQRSSLNQTLNDLFLDIWIDGWIYLSMNIYSARSPKSLIWPGNKALLWAQEAKGMSSVSSPFSRVKTSFPLELPLEPVSSTLLFWIFVSVPVPHALRAPLALCSPLISSLDGSDGLRRSFPTKMERAVSHRDVDSFSAPNEMGNRFAPLSLHLSPGSRRSNNRRGAPQYTIARSNWESYYT